MTDPIVTGGIGAAIATGIAGIVRYLEIRARFNGGRPTREYAEQIQQLIDNQNEAMKRQETEVLLLQNQGAVLTAQSVVLQTIGQGIAVLLDRNK